MPVEDQPGMGLEGQDAPGDPGSAGHIAGRGDHFLMAEMNAIEISDGDGRTQMVRRQVIVMAVYAHGGKKVSVPIGSVKNKARAMPFHSLFFAKLLCIQS